MSAEDNLLCVGMIIGAVLYWIHYVKVVRNPKNQSWYDSRWSPGSYYLFPYITLMLASISATALLIQLDIPKVVGYWLVKLTVFGVFVCVAIALLGLAGVPLPYPIVPKWLVKRRREERAKIKSWLKEDIQRLRERRRLRRRK
ncbi:hypothetical protein [Pseudoglutamicibacter albus]|uniref:Uncharacterized protein n=1 Tax=Pseudoglutamicibacter albus TaxID=98671 RepID=A0ABU1Z0A6_9MICC|nr:hypothetical protein [Pseudoglutamicibacter albus]MDR7293446.1 hypothetical protein [Pseudoglutamicibacter albus]